MHYGLTPRDYQREALAAVIAAEQRGIRRQVLSLPTGTGKTIIFAMVIACRRGRALVLAHLDALIDQAETKLRMMLGADAPIGIIKAERNELDAPIVVASVQTLARERRLTQLARDFRTVIVDEAHHAPAASYQTILDYLGCLPDPEYGADPDAPLLLGVTATLDRADKIGLAPTFEQVTFERSLLTMIRHDTLCDLRCVQVTLAANLDEVAWRGGDWQDGALGQALLDAKVPRYLVRAYQEHADGRRAVCFTPTVAVAEAVAEAFCAAGLPAQALSAKTPPEDRRAAQAALERGALACLVNCGIFLEGWDCPRVDCVIVARPTGSRSLYTQMVGRGTRKAPFKDDCLIIDVVGASARHEIMTVATLVGLHPVEVREHGVAEAADREAARDQERERIQTMRAMPGAMISAAVDLFARQRMAWVAAGDRFVLGYGGGYYIVEPEAPAATWRVVEQVDTEVTVLHTGLSVEYAQGVAEDLLRRAGRTALADRQGPWRQRPTSDKQRWKLRYLGYRGAIPATAGAASELIDRLQAGQPSLA